MIVALDARKLLDGGIGSYIRGLLDAFARDAGDPVVALADPSAPDGPLLALATWCVSLLLVG